MCGPDAAISCSGNSYFRRIAPVKYSLKFVLAIFLAMIFTLGTSEVARAQQATGRIIGNVTDPSGAGIPGVQVKATNVATQVSQETKTDRDGFFEILALPIGAYDVRVTATGFREQLFEHQVLQIAQSLRVDAKLVIGQQTDVVEVTTQAANIETQSETVGGTVVGEAIQQGPLNGRKGV